LLDCIASSNFTTQIYVRTRNSPSLISKLFQQKNPPFYWWV
jgi:hypothetical protein